MIELLIGTGAMVGGAITLVAAVALAMRIHFLLMVAGFAVALVGVAFNLGYLIVSGPDPEWIGWLPLAGLGILSAGIISLAFDEA